MGKKYKIVLGILLVVVLLGALVAYLRNVNIELFNSQGWVAEKQRNLIIFASLLSLVVIIPVYFLLFLFLHKYREEKKAKYTPEWDHNNTYETIWWGLPIALVLILSTVTWISTHNLDPFKPLVSDKAPLKVQVVALQWRWLFIYPDFDVATLNYLPIPTDRPIDFSITADAPMNSFWVPQLGGQVYAMSGMSTKLHLVADNPGVYNGSSANISGEGFAGMRFKVYATPQAEFDSWVADAEKANNYLSYSLYDELVKPSQDNEPTTFSTVAKDLYATIVNKYMLPTNASSSTTINTENESY